MESCVQIDKHEYESVYIYDENGEIVAFVEADFINPDKPDTIEPVFTFFKGDGTNGASFFDFDELGNISQALGNLHKLWGFERPLIEFIEAETGVAAESARVVRKHWEEAAQMAIDIAKKDIADNPIYKNRDIKFQISMPERFKFKNNQET